MMNRLLFRRICQNNEVLEGLGPLSPLPSLAQVQLLPSYQFFMQTVHPQDQFFLIFNSKRFYTLKKYRVF